MSRSSHIPIGIVVVSVMVLSILWEFRLESYFAVFVDGQNASVEGVGDIYHSYIHAIFLSVATFAIVSVVIAASTLLRKVEQVEQKENVSNETLEQLNFLKDQNCDEMQGYLFSRPLHGESFGKILTEGKRLSQVLPVKQPGLISGAQGG